jgi:hypothetical protein
VASALKTPGHYHAVNTLLERCKQIVFLYFTRARKPQDTDVGRILQTHGTCHVCGGVCAVVATESEDYRFVFHSFFIPR